ncbi:hypothetical protein LY76DRAFT_588280 [Colletotrichum caudatum]|nr:hypothetical protein LY76DRAFT_588280 [Colletotrichum caudatum]
MGMIRGLSGLDSQPDRGPGLAIPPRPKSASSNDQDAPAGVRSVEHGTGSRLLLPAVQVVSGFEHQCLSNRRASFGLPPFATEPSSLKSGRCACSAVMIIVTLVIQVAPRWSVSHRQKNPARGVPNGMDAIPCHPMPSVHQLWTDLFCHVSSGTGHPGFSGARGFRGSRLLKLLNLHKWEGLA